MKTIRLVAVLAAVVMSSACRQDMQDQPKYKPLGENRFFADGRDSRPIPPGTIARDEGDAADSLHTGNQNGAGDQSGQFLDAIPMPVDMKLLQRGRDRFDIYCSPCHGRVGDGNGMVAQRGLRAPANLHTDRLREAPPGYLYQVITNGYGGMGDYGDQVLPHDRWAIVAYIRALQLSRNQQASAIPAEARAQLAAQR